MKFKSYPIQVWFLSEDLYQSAQWLTNKCLNKSITGCLNVFSCVRFYYIGIRNFKAYKYFFDKEHKDDTMQRFFPLWPLKMRPSFNASKTRLTKWARMCREHYEYLMNYMRILLEEYEFRNKKPHGLFKFYDWDKFDAPQLQIPVGNLKEIVVPWKVLNPRYRDVDIYAGYRKQYKAMLENDGIKITDFKNRDIPEWLVGKKQNETWLE